MSGRRTETPKVCTRCDGNGRISAENIIGDPVHEPCPVCTPRSVEAPPQCEAHGGPAGFVDRCTKLAGHDGWHQNSFTGRRWRPVEAQKQRNAEIETGACTQCGEDIGGHSTQQYAACHARLEAKLVAACERRTASALPRAEPEQSEFEKRCAQPVDLAKARKAAQRLTDVAFRNRDKATGEPVRPHFEIPVHYEDDDVILDRALDELERLRGAMDEAEPSYRIEDVIAPMAEPEYEAIRIHGPRHQVNAFLDEWERRRASVDAPSRCADAPGTPNDHYEARVWIERRADQFSINPGKWNAAIDDLAQLLLESRSQGIEYGQRLERAHGRASAPRGFLDPQCFHVDAGKRCTRYLEGADAERASIVSWLRACGKPDSQPRDYANQWADAIEAKVHLEPRTSEAQIQIAEAEARGSSATDRARVDDGREARVLGAVRPAGPVVAAGEQSAPGSASPPNPSVLTCTGCGLENHELEPSKECSAYGTAGHHLLEREQRTAEALPCTPGVAVSKTCAWWDDDYDDTTSPGVMPESCSDPATHYSCCYSLTPCINVCAKHKCRCATPALRRTEAPEPETFAQLGAQVFNEARRNEAPPQSAADYVAAYVELRDDAAIIAHPLYAHVDLGREQAVDLVSVLRDFERSRPDAQEVAREAFRDGWSAAFIGFNGDESARTWEEAWSRRAVLAKPCTCSFAEGDGNAAPVLDVRCPTHGRSRERAKP